MDLLLKAGANPNVCDQKADGPLAMVTSYECATLLLRAGADPHHRNSFGYNSVIAAATLLPDPRYISELLLRGVDVNGPTESQDALQWFKRHDKSIVKMLLDHGARLNSIDAEGNSALAEFIWAGADDVAQLLLERGADYTTINSSGYNLLHVTAAFGSLGIIGILRAASLIDFDVDAVNNHGSTPWDLACQRVSKPDGFLEAFHSLLSDIRQSTAALNECITGRTL